MLHAMIFSFASIPGYYCIANQLLIHLIFFKPGLHSANPFLLPKFCASMWSKSESDEIQRIAKETVPGIKTMAIPQGLQAEKGPDAVVEFLKEKWPGLVEA
jgi:hypothetical protein